MTAATIVLTDVERAEAEVALLEEMLERLETVPGSWADWDEELRCADRQEIACEECAEALMQAREALAQARSAR